MHSLPYFVGQLQHCPHLTDQLIYRIAFMTKRYFAHAALVLVAASLFTACRRNDSATPASANLMVIHASPDAPAVGIKIDTSFVKGSMVTYPGNTGYLKVNSGKRNLSLVDAMTKANVLPSDSVNLGPNKFYSLFAINVADSLEYLFAEDVFPAKDTTLAYVRLMHLSPDAPAVDITASSSSFRTDAPLAFKQSTGFLPIPQGTYQFNVRTAGTQFNILQTQAITLTKGKVYTVFVHGLFYSSTSSLGAEVITNK